MTLTTTQISNFINELRTFSPVLERSELPSRWPESLLQDYSAKGNLLDRLIEINIALLNEINDLRPQIGTADPNGNVISNQSGIYMRNTATANDRQIWFNPDLGVNTGWLLMAERRP